MSPIGLKSQVPETSVPNVPTSKDPAKIRAAAQQFEALLMGQLLRSAHDGSGGWLGSGADSSSECATGFAEQYLAEMLAKGGGIGLGDLIAKGLQP